MLRYDAAIIGAGGDGLAAAIVLARAGLKTVLVERGAVPGGRFVTREFHPGFRACPFLDEMPPIPPALFWSLGLARAGAIMAPSCFSLALWPDRKSMIGHGRGRSALLAMAESRRRRDAVLTRAEADADAVPSRFPFLPKPRRAPWPGEDWAVSSLDDVLSERIRESDLKAHLMAAALAGRACDPFLAGTALHLLAPATGDGAVVLHGPGTFAEALAHAARAAGAEIACGMDVVEIRRGKRGIAMIGLAGGAEIEARAVISTLDLKQTFLSFFVRDVLPPELARRAGNFRMAGSTARVLFALDALPELRASALRTPLHVAPDTKNFIDAYAAWRTAAIPEAPPMLLRIVSADDPSLAPTGKAVMTATLGAIPFHLSDGAWMHEKRELLRDRALAAAESVLPGVLARVIATEVIVPPDIETALGATQGDLCGGEIASDQMLGLRPGIGETGPRTPVTGLYLAGSSTVAGVAASCVSGVMAARAVIADLKAGRLK